MRLRRALKKPVILLVVSLVIGLLPVISVLIAAAISSANDCVLHEGGVNPCVVWGVDLGELLYTLGVMGWFMLISIPFGSIGVLIALFWISIILLPFTQRKD